MQKTSTGYLIANYITRTLPLSIKDNPAERKRLVQQFIKEFVSHTRIKTTLGRLAVWGKGVFIFSLNVPLLNKKDIRGAVTLELKKRLPFQLTIENTSFDFFITGQVKDDKGLTIAQVTCIAADNAVLDEHVKFLKEMNLRPIGINTIPDALGNILSFCLKIPPQKSTAILDMGAAISTLNFYKAGVLRFSREIPIGGDHLTTALTRTITTLNGPVTIAQEDAEKVKRQCGVPSLEEAKVEFITDFGILLGEQISAMLRSTLERLIMELNRTFTYYTSTFKTPQVEELYLTGGSSRLKNVTKFLKDNLKDIKKVESLDILKAVKGWKDSGVHKQELVMEQAAPHLAVAFGLCMGKGAKINLLPVKEKLEQNALFFSSILKVFFPIIISLTILYYIFIFIDARKYRQSINIITTQLDQLEPTVKTAKEYRQIYAKLEERKALLEKTNVKQPYWWGLLKELSIITPEEVILTRISVENIKSMKIEGKISAKYTIVDVELQNYVAALDDSPYFEQVKVTSSKPDMYSAIPSATFIIECQVSYQ